MNLEITINLHNMMEKACKRALAGSIDAGQDSKLREGNICFRDSPIIFKVNT